MRHPGRSDGQDPVTIQDVARAAAVSTATVSRVLTGPARVRPGLAARVEAAVARHPGLHLLGASWRGVSVNDNVAQARTLAAALSKAEAACVS